MVQWTAMDFKGSWTPYWKVLRLVWPLALGMANNALMQFTDRVFLARESAASLEAILPASMLAFTFVCFFQSIAAYSGTFVAQYHGAGNPRGAAASCRAGLLLSLAAGIVLALLIPLGRIICDWCGHPPDVLAREKTYYTIVMSGGFFLCAAMAVQSFFTGIGRTRLVFWVNLLGNAANILLDYLLIFGCGPIPASGIAGAAVATVIAQFLQFAVLTAFAWPHIFVRRAPDAPSAPGEHLIWRMLRFGTPAGIYSVLNILSFAVFVFLTGRVGDMALAVSNATLTVNYLIYAPIEGFAIGASTLVGQHQGAGDSVGAARDARRALILAEIYIIVAALAALAFHGPILDLFVADTATFDHAAFRSLGFTLFSLMMAWQCFDCADVVLSGALKGAGDTHFVMFWMLFCAFGFWMPLLFLVYWLHPTMPALWSTMIAYVALICAGTWIRWRRGPWRTIKLV